MAALLLAGFPVFAGEATVSWQSVTLAGNKIGHRQIVREVNAGVVRTTERLQLTLQQPGDEPRQSETVLVYTESLQGEALQIEKSVRSSSANHTMTARVDGGTLHVERADGRHREKMQFALPSNFLLREGVRRALLSLSGDTRELEYTSWNFSAHRLDSFVLRASREPVGRPYAWRIWRENTRSGQSEPTELLADHQFFVQEERAVSGGEKLVLTTCDKACALENFDPVTHVYRQLVRSPVRISESALRGRVRYLLQGEFAVRPPETGEQHIERVDAGWRVEVCDDCGQEDAPGSEVLAKALAASYWIAADSPAIRARVVALLGEGAAARNAADVHARMKTLTRFVNQHMREQPDYSGYATALEAFESRQGDCTEHALLLASMARAAGIPARIAAGMAYSNERFMGRKFVFAPHAWVQIWDGERWRSYDSGLGEFSAGYITLGISDGELADIAHINEQLHRIEIVSAVQLLARGQ